MRRWLTTPWNTSRLHTTAQVGGAVEGWVVGRGEVTCSAVSGKFLAWSASSPRPSSATRSRIPHRIVVTRGEATAANFVQLHVDDRVLISTPDSQQVENLGRRSSYTYQLEARRSSLRDGTLALDPTTPRTRCG
jgi:hypothetical protein